MDADAIPDVGRTGGLVGHLGSAAINNSYATGNVRPITRAFLLSIASTLPLPAPMVSVTSMDPRIGGLVGGLNNNNVIAGGGVIDNSYSTGTVLGGMDVGGLVGHSSDGTITKSYSSSTSVMGDQDVGGLVGELITTMVFKSYANSTTNGQQYTGGLIGSFNDSVISLSYASGAVSGSLAGSGTGGLVGNLEGGTAMTPTSATIADSFATGNVSGGFRVSGLVGGIAPFTTGSIQRAYAFQSSIVGADVATLLALVGENASGGMGFSGLFYNDALLFLPQPVSDSLGDNKTLASLLGAPGTAYLTGKGFTFGAGAWKSQNTILPYLDWMP